MLSLIFWVHSFNFFFLQWNEGKKNRVVDQKRKKEKRNTMWNRTCVCALHTHWKSGREREGHTKKYRMSVLAWWSKKKKIYSGGVDTKCGLACFIHTTWIFAMLFNKKKNHVVTHAQKQVCVEHNFEIRKWKKKIPALCMLVCNLFFELNMRSMRHFFLNIRFPTPKCIDLVKCM